MTNLSCAVHAKSAGMLACLLLPVQHSDCESCSMHERNDDIYMIIGSLHIASA